MSTPSFLDETSAREVRDSGEREVQAAVPAQSAVAGQAGIVQRVKDELWQPRYLALTAIIVVLMLLQVWVLF